MCVLKLFIVLGASNDVSGVDVVAMGTGSKCIGSEKMDKNGNVCISQ